MSSLILISHRFFITGQNDTPTSDLLASGLLYRSLVVVVEKLSHGVDRICLAALERRIVFVALNKFRYVGPIFFFHNFCVLFFREIDLHDWWNFCAILEPLPRSTNLSHREFQIERVCFRFRFQTTGVPS